MNNDSKPLQLQSFWAGISLLGSQPQQWQGHSDTKTGPCQTNNSHCKATESKGSVSVLPTVQETQQSKTRSPQNGNPSCILSSSWPFAMGNRKEGEELPHLHFSALVNTLPHLQAHGAGKLLGIFHLHVPCSVTPHTSALQCRDVRPRWVTAALWLTAPCPRSLPGPQQGSFVSKDVM